MLSAFLGTSFFLYNFIFLKLDNARLVVLLSSDVPIDSINMENYRKSLGYLELKNSSIPFVFPVRNIFSYAEKIQKPISAATIVTTTKK